jgi:hypothetical protein
MLIASQIPKQQNNDFVCANKGSPKRSVSTLRATTKGTPGASAGEILAKISFSGAQRPTIQLVGRVSYIYCEKIYVFYR